METKASLPISIWGATRVDPVINGKIYVTHGLDGTNFYTTNFVYDTITNAWELKGLANHARDGVGCGIIDNKLYVIGGRNVTNSLVALILMKYMIH
ncbi:MAG: hypothetical protein IPH45_21330 [Bacteroidales bacterium]|nr:hypothetical protein [Bacteroidales bacterium]